ncbi:kinase-like domain-containing protein, partial [Bisporella sp. PMI_857]
SPDLSIINKIASRILPNGPFTCEFLVEGSFNKVYRLVDQDGSSDFILRAALPIDPFYKTASEVATIHFVQRTTQIPVPEVIAYDPVGNELGFEWIIQRFMPGVKLSDIWTELSLEDKMTIGREVTGYLHELRKHHFDAIGNLYF